MLWHIGNTTVRNPYRLREGLSLLSTSSLPGQLIGKTQEQLFAQKLHDAGIVTIKRLEEDSNNWADDLGRKWRSSLTQLGFLTPKLSRRLVNEIDPQLLPHTHGFPHLTGRPYEITPNGQRLIAQQAMGAIQDCFLRALLAYRIPSCLEPRYPCPAFCPLQFVLRLFRALSERGSAASLTFQEYALFVQTSHPGQPMEALINDLLVYRHGREAISGNKKAYDQQCYEKVAHRCATKVSTLKDYADASLNHFKATGLFQTQGKAIVIAPAKSALALLLLDQTRVEGDYLPTLWQGYALPTDDQALAGQVVHALRDALMVHDPTIPATPDDASLEQLQALRYQYEQALSHFEERAYAKKQVDCLDEIIHWLKAIETGKPQRRGDQTFRIPTAEAPVYLEWIIWRAFLAINALANPPWESRNFKIDQDFMPVSCAPSGRPDIVLEFQDSVLVVEVTLTSSSRQEAAEGEPVRRHVAKLVDDYANRTPSKRVYGLFLAKKIDSNTAHTFTSGDWYRADDSKLSLEIVPLTLSDFLLLLDCYQEDITPLRQWRTLFVECRASANQPAPDWKRAIHQHVQAFCQPNKKE